MKTTISVILLFISFTTTAQKQERYMDFLEAALTAAEKKDSAKVILYLEYFSAAIDEDVITPQKLNKKALDIYTKALYISLANELKLPDRISKRAVPFLEYDIEKKPENMFSLGYLYEAGIGVLQSENHAKYWYEKSAGKGIVTALNNLGLIHFKNKDFENAEKYLLKAANAGNLDAMKNLCILYANKDIEKCGIWAFELEKRAIKNPILEGIEQGDERATLLFAIFYEQGYGYSKNSIKARTNFEKLVKQKYIPALMYLGSESLKNENWELAEKYLETIYGINSHKDAAGLLAYVNYLRKKNRQAKRWAEIAKYGGNPYGYNILANIKCDNAMTVKDFDECKYLQERAEDIFKVYELFKDIQQPLKMQTYRTSLLPPQKNN